MTSGSVAALLLDTIFVLTRFNLVFLVSWGQARLDSHGYASLEDVKADFDLCFKNAKRYNMKNSDIWLAARDLQVRVQRVYLAREWLIMGMVASCG